VNRDSGARRLAVQLHNRKHPVPAGVYVLVLTLLTAIVFVTWMQLHESPKQKEIRELREEIKKDREKLEKM
jgi:uncharacterized membrane protein YqjE